MPKTKIARGLPVRKGFQEWELRTYFDEPSGDAKKQKSEVDASALDSARLNARSD